MAGAEGTAKPKSAGARAPSRALIKPSDRTVSRKVQRAKRRATTRADPGRSGISCRVHRAGKAGCLARPVVTANACVPSALPSAHEAIGCGWHPAFPAPSQFRGARPKSKTSGKTCRENDHCCLRTSPLVMAGRRPGHPDQGHNASPKRDHGHKRGDDKPKEAGAASALACF